LRGFAKWILLDFVEITCSSMQDLPRGKKAAKQLQQDHSVASNMIYVLLKKIAELLYKIIRLRGSRGKL